MQGQNSRKCKRIQASHDSNRLKSQFEKKHVNNTTKSCYTTLNVLRKNKRYKPLRISSFIKTRLLQRIIIWYPKIYETTTSESIKCSDWFSLK